MKKDVLNPKKHTPLTLAQEQTRLGQRTAWVAGVVNTFLALSKTGVGVATQSNALIADGVHSLADLTTDVITYFSLKIGRQEPDADHPYGHGKFETIGTLTLATTLGLTALGIAWHTTQNLLGEHLITPSFWALIAAGASILANEALFFYTLHVSKKINSDLLAANAWHHRADSLSSLVALAGVGLSLLGYPAFDAIAAFILVGVLLKIAYSSGKKAIYELVETAVAEDFQEKIRGLAQEVEGVRSTHLLRARRMGTQTLVDIHVEVASHISVSEGHYIAESVEQKLLSGIGSIADVVVHVDPYADENTPLPEMPPRATLEAFVEKTLAQHTPAAKMQKLTLHILPEGLSGHLLLANVHLQPEELELLKKHLNDPTGPFKHISVAVLI